MLRSSSANRYCKENLYWHFQAENVFLIKVSSPNNLLGYHSYCIWWYQGYHRYCIWWNHRIINRFGLEGIFKGYLEQHPLRWAPHTLRHQTQLQNHCRWPFSSLNILSKILIMCLIKWVSLKNCHAPPILREIMNLLWRCVSYCCIDAIDWSIIPLNTFLSMAPVIQNRNGRVCAHLVCN